MNWWEHRGRSLNSRDCWKIGVRARHCATVGAEALACLHWSATVRAELCWLLCHFFSLLLQKKVRTAKEQGLWSIIGSNGLVCLCMPQPVVCVSSPTEKSVNQILKSIEACPLPPGSCDKKSNVHEVLFWGMRKVAVPVLPVAPAANETGRVVLISLAVCPPALTFK